MATRSKLSLKRVRVDDDLDDFQVPRSRRQLVQSAAPKNPAPAAIGQAVGGSIGGGDGGGANPAPAPPAPPAPQGRFDPSSIFIDLDPTNLCEKVRTEDEARQVFEWLGMLPTRDHRPPCHGCGRDFGTKADAKQKLGWRYRCKACGTYVSALKGTWFAGSHLTFMQHLKLLLCFVSGCSTKQIVKFTRVHTEAVTQWTTYAKEVMEVVLSNDTEKIGGEGKFVEVDESVLVRRKYNRGRRLATENRQVCMLFT